MNFKILLLDPTARAGRTGFRLTVKDAKRLRADVRWMLGVSRDDAPTTRDILRAAADLNQLLYDATNGDAIIAVFLKGTSEPVSPVDVLATFKTDRRGDPKA